MNVEVLYALPDRQHQVEIALPDGATIAQAIERLAQMPECSGWQVDESAVGVFGQLRPVESVLKDSGTSKAEVSEVVLVGGSTR